MPAKPFNLITAKSWPSGRPDGQTAETQSDPAPTGKASSTRPGSEKLTVRVPTQIGQKFKLLCALNHVEQKDVVAGLLAQWNDAMTGRPDGQTALNHDLDDLRPDRLIDDDEENKFLTSSSDQGIGRPDGQESPDAKRRELLAYYSLLTGNQLKQNDRDFLETILDVPIAAIKGGIAQSLLRCQTRINSLRYCAGAIEEIFEARGADSSFSIYLETVLAREGKWNSSLTPIDQRAMQATVRRYSRSQDEQSQPTLPGAGADLVQLPRETTLEEATLPGIDRPVDQPTNRSEREIAGSREPSGALEMAINAVELVMSVEKLSLVDAIERLRDAGPPPDAVPDSEVWKALLNEIKIKLGAESFDSWFKPIRFDGIDRAK